MGSTTAPGSDQLRRTWATARAYTTRPSLRAAFTTKARTALRLAGCLASKLQGRSKLCTSDGLWLRLGKYPEAKSAGAWGHPLPLRALWKAPATLLRSMAVLTGVRPMQVPRQKDLHFKSLHMFALEGADPRAG